MKIKNTRKTKRNGKLALIASEAADIIRAKSRWCQGHWGGKIGAAGGEVVGACMAGLGHDKTYVQANSPEAVKWCVEGAIYKAAKGKGGFRLGHDVIKRLDAMVHDDPEVQFETALDLNDDNGDESRQYLLKALRALAKDLREQAA